MQSQVVVAQEDAVLPLINRERSWAGQPPHRADPRLEDVADGLARRLVERGPDAMRPAWVDQELDAAGYRWRLRYLLRGYNYDSAAAFFEAFKTQANGREIMANALPLDLAVVRRETDERLQRRGIRDIWVAFAALPDQAAPNGWRANILEQVNRFRRQFALPDLILNESLNRAAQAHVDDMAVSDYFAHRSRDGRSPGDRAEAFGYGYQVVLENLAAGMSLPEDVVEGWKASKDGHREAMLDPRPVEVGIGYRYHPHDRGRARHFHYWAMTMGQPRNAGH